MGVGREEGEDVVRKRFLMESPTAHYDNNHQTGRRPAGPLLVGSLPFLLLLFPRWLARLVWLCCFVLFCPVAEFPILPSKTTQNGAPVCVCVCACVFH